MDQWIKYLNKKDTIDKHIISLVKSGELKIGIVALLIFFLNGCIPA